MSKVSQVAIGLALFAAGLGYAGYQFQRHEQRLHRVEQAMGEVRAGMDEVLGEVTRVRLEQKAEHKGVRGLLETLAVYAPVLTKASTSDPIYESTLAEMKAVLRAFATIGEDAWQPIAERIAALDPQQSYDECRWLLEAAVAADQRRGVDLVRKVTLGLDKPHPRLRHAAADILVRADIQLAQATLRQILLTESARGVNLDRAQAYGGAIPDQAALSSNAFFNFVGRYAQTKDEQCDETLLMVMSRAEHDLMTIQECIDALGRRRCAPAVEPIQRVFANVPGNQYNPLFRNHCLEALAAIQGDAARPFFEQALTGEQDPTVKKRLEHLLGLEPKPAEPARPPLQGPGIDGGRR
jgi:hypothetical protein